jgi:hypothetical protein
LTLCGDFHSHCIAGSTVPSPADCKAWAGTGDMLNRDCYVSLIVSPSAKGSGWSIPTFTPWIAYRRGRPSRPYVARASLEW